MRDPRRWSLVLLALGVLGLGGCTRIERAMASLSFLNFMHESPSFDPYEAPRPGPANAVPVASPGEHWEPEIEPTEANLVAWGDTLTNPLAMSEPVVTRGATIFSTYCSVCHGVAARGDGPIVGPGKFPLATDLTLPTTAGRSDGYIYAVVRVGRGLMPSYRRIPPSDRWAVVNYVRHLQGGGEPIQVSLPGQVQPGMDALNVSGGQGSAPAGDAGADEAQGQE